MQVRLRCGLSNELNGVDEPSRCECVISHDTTLIFTKIHIIMLLFCISVSYVRYVAVLSTPALCVEEKLKVLSFTVTNVFSFFAWRLGANRVLCYITGAATETRRRIFRPGWPRRALNVTRQWLHYYNHYSIRQAIEVHG